MNAVEIVGLSADVLGLAAFSVSAYLYWRLRSKYARAMKARAAIAADGTAAVAIGIGTSIAPDVRRYLQQHYPGVHLAVDYYREGMIRGPEYLDAIRAVRDELRHMMEVGPVRRVLLFYGGPYAPAVAIGALFDNWVPVEVFQRDTGRATYEHAYTLDAETVKGV
jgi:hypothetical protein